jgi:hypothetical protein
LQPDIRISVRRPHDSINMDPDPLLFFCATPEDAAKGVTPPAWVMAFKHDFWEEIYIEMLVPKAPVDQM